MLTDPRQLGCPGRGETVEVGRPHLTSSRWTKPVCWPVPWSSECVAAASPPGLRWTLIVPAAAAVSSLELWHRELALRAVPSEGSGGRGSRAELVPAAGVSGAPGPAAVVLGSQGLLPFPPQLPSLSLQPPEGAASRGRSPLGLLLFRFTPSVVPTLL